MAHLNKIINDNGVNDNVAQNIYDNDIFFKGYKTLRENDSGLNGCLETPRIRQELPDLKGLSILDLGCGHGDFCEYAIKNGASHVTAIDVSQLMLKEAMDRNQEYQDKITFLNVSIEDLSTGTSGGDDEKRKLILQHGPYDLVVSSLVFHYINDYASAVKYLYSILKQGGKLVFSVEHPFATCSTEGWIFDKETKKKLYWAVDHYHSETKRESTWFVDGVITYHRTCETYITQLLNAGFRLDCYKEPTPLPERIHLNPILADQLRRPPFLIIGATKPLN
eukprot:gene2333-2881_t